MPTIEVGQAQTVAPLTTQQRAVANAQANLNGVQVIKNLPAAHARRIDLLIQQTATGGGKGVQAIYLVSWSAGREIGHQVQINGPFTTSTHAVVVADPFNTATNEWAIGETIDIWIDNGSQANTITAYAIARP